MLFNNMTICPCKLNTDGDIRSCVYRRGNQSRYSPMQLQERRLLNISTNDYKIWHVSEYGKVLMDEKARNHLHEGDTYVVRWYYLITATGRTLKVSNTFCCLFFLKKFF